MFQVPHVIRDGEMKLHVWNRAKALRDPNAFSPPANRHTSKTLSLSLSLSVSLCVCVCVVCGCERGGGRRVVAVVWVSVDLGGLTLHQHMS